MINLLKYLLLFVPGVVFSVGVSIGQVNSPRTFSTSRDTLTDARLPSNSVSHIHVGSDQTVWIGSGKGLARRIPDGSWESFRSEPAFAHEGIYAIAGTGDTIWCSTGYDKELDQGSVQTGSGYAYSTDDGSTWTHRDQVLDQRGDSILSYGINDSLWILPVVVPEQNVTFDISLTDSTVWVASWASGLRKSTDLGLTWERVLLPPDNRNRLSPGDTLWTYAPDDTLQTRRLYERLDPRRNNNMLAFSVLALDESNVWCGTAGGINKSTDGGRSWVRYTQTNQSSPILGNWVIAVRFQSFPRGADTVRRVWTTNWQAEGRDEQYGVSYSDDNGRSWSNFLHGVRAYDFAFRDSVAYIATNRGVFRTADGGRTMSQVTEISDPEHQRTIATSSFFSVGTLNDTVLVGTGDGLAFTTDDGANSFGSSWTISRAYQPVQNAGDSYAYPNPFSPGAEQVRIHYGILMDDAGGPERSVRIQIFDFGMNRVRTLVSGSRRAPGREYEDLWDGRDDGGNTVSNGVYFYRIDVDSVDPLFGKIIVMQ